MNKADFFKALAEIIQSYSAVPIDTLDPDDKLFSSGLIDSLNIVEVIEFIESYYGIQISPTDFSMDNFDSMTAIARYAADKLSGKF